uniref:DUF7920 domain-containing protein n=1 Tax=Percolomonas cosmopolitus TaxID=63605 RepID=A0A7S1KUP7_9EUKA
MSLSSSLPLPPFLPLPHSSSLTKHQFDDFLQFIAQHESLGHRRQEFLLEFEEQGLLEDQDQKQNDSENWETSKCSALSLHLYDCKIQCRGPDDRIYLSQTIPHHERIRRHITRGCVLVHLKATQEDQQYDSSKEQKRPACFYLFQGYGKFLGMTEDDDDDMARQKDSAASNAEQQNVDESSTTQSDLFFHEKHSNAHHLIRIEKENGKAAHFAVIKLPGAPNSYLFVAGSKNVHILFRNREDVQRVQDKERQNSKWRNHGPSLHCRIAELLLDFLDEMDKEKREEFLSTLSGHGLMMNFELMLKEEQHVVDYQLEKHELRFLAFTPRTFENDEFCNQIGKCLPVVASMEWVKQFGFKTARYEVEDYTPDNLQKMIESVRKTPNSEGAVIYFADAYNRTLGLWKVKSEWYIILRAIREKLVNMYVDFNARIASRMRQLQNRLSLSNEDVWRWNLLADALHKYTKERIREGQIQEDSQAIRDGFATLLTTFLKEYKHPENVREVHSKLEMTDMSPLSMAAKSKKRKGNWQNRSDNGGNKRKRQKQNKQQKKQKTETNGSARENDKRKESSDGGFQLHYL